MSRRSPSSSAVDLGLDSKSGPRKWVWVQVPPSAFDCKGEPPGFVQRLALFLRRSRFVPQGFNYRNLVGHLVVRLVRDDVAIDFDAEFPARAIDQVHLHILFVAQRGRQTGGVFANRPSHRTLTNGNLLHRICSFRSELALNDVSKGVSADRMPTGLNGARGFV